MPESKLAVMSSSCILTALMWDVEFKSCQRMIEENNMNVKDPSVSHSSVISLVKLHHQLISHSSFMPEFDAFIG